MDFRLDSGCVGNGNRTFWRDFQNGKDSVCSMVQPVLASAMARTVRASKIIIFLGSFIGKNLVDRKMDSIKLNDHFANTKKIIFCILFNNWNEFIFLSLLTVVAAAAAAVLTVHDSGDLAKRIVNEISYFSNSFFLVRCQIFQSRGLK